VSVPLLYIAIVWCVCVCVCVWPGKPYIMEKNVPTNIAICEILAGTFFWSPMRKQLISH